MCVRMCAQVVVLVLVLVALAVSGVVMPTNLHQHLKVLMGDTMTICRYFECAYIIS